jgi:hypothetical protein
MTAGPRDPQLLGELCEGDQVGIITLHHLARHDRIVLAPNGLFPAQRCHPARYQKGPLAIPRDL